jgi:hypothetical protein
MAIVYQHRRLDTGDIFYVGIGTDPRRPYQKKNRNSIWKNITNKTEYQVEILFEDVSWEEACNIEVELIKKYGRMYLNEGTLANMAEGGQCGTVGLKRGPKYFSDEHRQKLSEARLRNLSNRQDTGWKYCEVTTGKEGTRHEMRKHFPGFTSSLATDKIVSKGPLAGYHFKKI